MLSLPLYRPVQFGNQDKRQKQATQKATTHVPEPLAAPRNRILSRQDIATLKPADVVIVIAHPDDETLFAPGLMPYLERLNKRYQVVYATIGDAGRNRLTNRKDPASMPDIRRRELTNAFRMYHSPRPPLVLDYKDGQVSKSTAGVQRDISAILKTLNPQEVYTFGPGGMSNHPDHKAIGKVVRDEVSKTAPDIKLIEFIHTEDFIVRLKQRLKAHREADMLTKVTQWWAPYAASTHIQFRPITDQDKALSGDILKNVYTTQFTAGESNAFAEAWHDSRGPSFRDVALKRQA